MKLAPGLKKIVDRFWLEHLRGHARAAVGRPQHRERRLRRHRHPHHRLPRHRLPKKGRPRPAPGRPGPLVHHGHGHARVSAAERAAAPEAGPGQDGSHCLRRRSSGSSNDSLSPFSNTVEMQKSHVIYLKKTLCKRLEVRTFKENHFVVSIRKL